MGSDGGGVVNSDFVLYVSAKTTGLCSTGSIISSAGVCQMENEYDRFVSMIFG